MTELTGEARARYVRRLFGRITQRYDLLNRLMTLGRDRAWRREAVRLLDLPSESLVLDAGAGTGDLAFEIRRQRPRATVIAADFTPEMMTYGRTRPGGEAVRWIVADARRLPFRPDAFDGAVSGFLLRNVPEVDTAIAEQRRVLKPGARVVALDTTPPRPGFLRPLLEFYLHTIIPLLGRIVAGDAEAYNYLPDSTERFLSAEMLADRMRTAGLKQVGFARRMFATIALHWGTKTP